MMYDRAKLRELLDIAESAGLDCPADFRSADIDDLAVYCNGIGADWMTENSRRKLTSMMSYAEAAAMIHDYEYHFSNASEKWRAKADERFLVNALREIRYKFKWWQPKRWFAERAVLIGYCVLQRVGRAAWAIAFCERQCKKTKGIK